MLGLSCEVCWWSTRHTPASGNDASTSSTGGGSATPQWARQNLVSEFTWCVHGARGYVEWFSGVCFRPPLLRRAHASGLRKDSADGTDLGSAARYAVVQVRGPDRARNAVHVGHQVAAKDGAAERGGHVDFGRVVVVRLNQPRDERLKTKRQKKLCV